MDALLLLPTEEVRRTCLCMAAQLLALIFLGGDSKVDGGGGGGGGGVPPSSRVLPSMTEESRSFLTESHRLFRAVPFVVTVGDSLLHSTILFPCSSVAIRHADPSGLDLVPAF